MKASGAVDPGLCNNCRFHRLVRSSRGSQFWLCRRAAFDERFVRYPRLPVLRCVGYEPEPEPGEGGGAEADRIAPQLDSGGQTH